MQARHGLAVESVSWAREGRHKAGTYGDLMGLAGRGQTRHVGLGACSNIDTRPTRDVVGEGALRGRSPRTREGRIGPTAQNCSG